MQISKYGIVLKSMEPAELELVRNWRNAEHVRPYMSYRDYITPAMQERWFSELDRENNLYFIIQQNEKKIGVVNLKDINRQLRSAEAGIFIGEPDYINTMLPVLATIALMEFAFDVLTLSNLKAKINNTNSKVILFNQSIGYKKEKYQNDTAFHYYVVTHSDFITATKRIRQTLEKLNADGFTLTVSEYEKLLHGIRESS